MLQTHGHMYLHFGIDNDPCSPDITCVYKKHTKVLETARYKYQLTVRTNEGTYDLEHFDYVKRLFG